MFPARPHAAVRSQGTALCSQVSSPFLKIKPDNLNDVSGGSLSLTFAPNHVIDVISVVADGHAATCFIFRSEGKVLVERARAGVREGFKFGQLAKGNDVVSEDRGELVKAADCLEKPEPRSIVGVITCPTMHAFRRLAADPVMKRYTGAGDPGGSVTCVYHRTPADVVNTDAYTAWIDSFGEDVQHVISRRESSPRGTAFAEAHRCTIS